MSDIVIIGLQEMVELSTKKVIQGKDKPRAAVWENIFANCLNQNRFGIQYIPISQKLMVEIDGDLEGGELMWRGDLWLAYYIEKVRDVKMRP